MEISNIISSISLFISLLSILYMIVRDRWGEQNRLIDLRRIFVNDINLQKIFYDLDYGRIKISLNSKREKNIDMILVYFDCVCHHFYNNSKKVNMQPFDYYLKRTGENQLIQGYLKYINKLSEQVNTKNPYMFFIRYLNENYNIKLGD